MSTQIPLLNLTPVYLQNTDSILNTLIFLSYYLLFLFSILGYGLLFCNLLTVNFKKTNLGLVGLLGICFLSFISYFTNLFLPHSFIHNSIVHFAII